MSAAALAHPRLRAWPVSRRDTLQLALWNAAEIAEATGGVASGDFQCAGVEMDSRDIRPGDLFVALQGEAMDGHRFIDKAFAAGAAAAIVDRPIDWPHVLVKDTTAALHALAAAARRRLRRSIPSQPARFEARPLATNTVGPSRPRLAPPTNAIMPPMNFTNTARKGISPISFQ